MALRTEDNCRTLCYHSRRSKGFRPICCGGIDVDGEWNSSRTMMLMPKKTGAANAAPTVVLLGNPLADNNERLLQHYVPGF